MARILRCSESSTMLSVMATPRLMLSSRRHPCGHRTERAGTISQTLVIVTVNCYGTRRRVRGRRWSPARVGGGQDGPDGPGPSPPIARAATRADPKTEGEQMNLEVDKSDLHRMRAVERPPVPLEPGQARLRVDAFGLTSNNITYAVYGEAMRYWACFPAPEDETGWGRVPVWGFGEVVESSTPGVADSTRVYGYFPMADEVVVQPGRIDDSGFSDLTATRGAVPAVYSRYSFVESDPVYDADREAQQMLLWPLMVTSFVVDDFLGDHGLFGATTAVISSASAKTAIAAAFLLAERDGVEVVGLTSGANLGFVAGLGCYDTTVTYDDVDSLPTGDACFIDIAGRRDVTRRVHAHFGDHLRYSMVVGDTHWDNRADRSEPLTGPRPVFLFAPDQIAKRRRDWGRDGFERTVAAAWNRFVPWTDRWLTIRHAVGADEVEAVYHSLLDGRIDPGVGDVCTLAGTVGRSRPTDER